MDSVDWIIQSGRVPNDRRVRGLISEIPAYRREIVLNTCYTLLDLNAIRLQRMGWIQLRPAAAGL